MLITVFRYTSKMLPLSESEDSLFYFHLVKHSEFLLKHVQLFYIQFVPFGQLMEVWTHHQDWHMRRGFGCIPCFNKHLHVFPIAETFPQQRAQWEALVRSRVVSNRDYVKTAIPTLHHSDQGHTDSSHHMSSNTFLWNLDCKVSMKRSGPIFRGHPERGFPQDQRLTTMQL